MHLPTNPMSCIFTHNLESLCLHKLLDGSRNVARFVSGAHHRDACGDEMRELILRQLVGAGVAAVIHQRDEGRPAVGLLVGQRKIVAEGAVDEFRAGVGAGRLPISLVSHDLAVVRELRQHTKATFRVDANCAWTAEQTLAIVPELKALGVEFIEQPLPAGRKNYTKTQPIQFEEFADWEGKGKPGGGSGAGSATASRSPRTSSPPNPPPTTMSCWSTNNSGSTSSAPAP